VALGVLITHIHLMLARHTEVGASILGWLH
jgi:hypothetical protein